MKKFQEEDDFGFALVDEEELRRYEEELKERLVQEQLNAEQLKKQEETLKERLVQEQLTSAQKLEGLKKLFMPLLVNLSKSPEKSYIFWPNRVEKIEAFIKKIDQYIDENK